MTNYAHTHTNANTDTEYQSMIAHLEAAQRKLLAKYGMTLEDTPTLLRGLAKSFDGSCPEMDRTDERLLLIYIGMMETHKYIEVAEELSQAKQTINELNEDIDGICEYVRYLHNKVPFDDEEGEDGEFLNIETVEFADEN
ncbi:hypothetical protein GBZ48_17805 [Azospirillum melinis]|uniref:Uncharacterized protein n=1 Tax=Azospirillum melinis TaxID=328839 RepID=A0ABX2KKH2_9PROT|nr:hypothetical protein [Azospirillum melinis]MBP2304602.1 cell division protein ZapA (FtsZ GTPase activity inhibitor) [Azospirillum melinis]NUB01132.1 hypothetical protein [Azospirillum melinis]